MTMGPFDSYVMYYKPSEDGPISGGSGSSSTGGGSNSTGGGSSTDAGSGAAGVNSTNTLNGIGLIARSVQINRDLDNNSLINKYNVQPSVLEAIKKRFPLKDPQNVTEAVTLYASFYNLKCKTLIELTVLKNLSIQNDSALASRITKLDNISNECSETMDKYENALNRDSKRFIAKTYKKKP